MEMQTEIKGVKCGGTVIETAENACMKLLSDNQELAALVFQKYPICAHMKEWVYQRPNGTIPTIVEMHVAVQLVAGVEGGLIAIVGVNFGETPSADKREDENQEKLNTLPHPFYAEFDRTTKVGLLDCDGVFGWSEPVTADTCNGEITLPPMAVPLEVGYMPAGKMLYGINQERGPGLARWAYGYESIVAFIPLREGRTH